MKTTIYEPRWYRNQCAESKLEQFFVRCQESDLCIRSETNLSSLAYNILIRVRKELESYIIRHSEFGRSLVPVSVLGDAPDIAIEMAQAALKTGVGPMAAVAGAVNHALACELMHFGQTLIIENGGDIFASSHEPVMIALYAGNSPLSMHLALKVDASSGVGVCTSSGTVGHSLSFGKADAVTIIANDCILADAAATAIGNQVNSRDDFNAAIEFAKTIEDISGVIIVQGDRIAAWGKKFEIVGI